MHRKLENRNKTMMPKQKEDETKTKKTLKNKTGGGSPNGQIHDAHHHHHHFTLQYPPFSFILIFDCLGTQKVRGKKNQN